MHHLLKSLEEWFNVLGNNAYLFPGYESDEKIDAAGEFLF